jgi:hypothetical protein
LWFLRSAALPDRAPKRFQPQFRIASLSG